MPVIHDHTVSGPHFEEMELSPLDQMYGSVYSCRILAFEGLPTDIQDTTSVLLKALQATVNDVPFLAGSAVAASDVGRTDNRISIVPGKARLVVNDLTSTVSFAAMKAKGFPSSEFAWTTYLPLPQIAPPLPGTPRDVFMIQANLVDGGLFLAYSYHHIIADGTSMTELTRLFASHCAVISDGEDHATTPRTATKLNLNRADIVQIPADVDPDACLQYYKDYSDLSTHLGSLKARTDMVNAQFHLSPASAAKLKAAASSSPATKPNTTTTTTTWISTSDALNALIWRAIVRARLSASIIQPADPFPYSNAVDFRSQLPSPLPLGWIGNAFILISTTPIPASEVVRPGPAGLAAAARAIRASVQAVNAKLVGSLLHRARAAPDPMLFMPKAIVGMATTNVLCSSQRAYVHADMAWGKRAFGTYEGIIAPSGSPVDGMVLIMPPLRDGGWEVTVSLTEGCMEVLRRDEEFGMYMKEVGL